MIRKLMESQTIILNYNAKSSIEPEIFGIFQHKVEGIPHFARVSEVRHMLCATFEWALCVGVRGFVFHCVTENSIVMEWG